MGGIATNEITRFWWKRKRGSGSGPKIDWLHLCVSVCVIVQLCHLCCMLSSASRCRVCARVRLCLRLRVCLFNCVLVFLRSLFTTAQLTHSFETRVRPFLHLCTWVHVCVCVCLFFYCSPSRIRFLIDLDRTRADLYCNGSKSVLSGWNQGAIIIKVFFWHLLMSWLTLNFRHFQTPKATATSLHA